MGLTWADRKKPQVGPMFANRYPCSPIFANLRHALPSCSPIFATAAGEHGTGARARVPAGVGEHGNHGADLRLYMFATSSVLAKMGLTCGFFLSPQVGPIFANSSPCSPIFATFSLHVRQYIYAGQNYLCHVRQVFMCSRARGWQPWTRHILLQAGAPSDKRSSQGGRGTLAVRRTTAGADGDMRRGT